VSDGRKQMIGTEICSIQIEAQIPHQKFIYPTIFQKIILDKRYILE
jgi:hypothetical protein